MVRPDLRGITIKQDILHIVENDGNEYLVDPVGIRWVRRDKT